MIITLKSYFPAIDIHFHYSNIQIPDIATVQDVWSFLKVINSYLK